MWKWDAAFLPPPSPNDLEVPPSPWGCWPYTVPDSCCVVIMEFGVTHFLFLHTGNRWGRQRESRILFHAQSLCYRENNVVFAILKQQTRNALAMAMAPAPQEPFHEKQRPWGLLGDEVCRFHIWALNLKTTLNMVCQKQKGTWKGCLYMKVCEKG